MLTIDEFVYDLLHCWALQVTRREWWPQKVFCITISLKDLIINQEGNYSKLLSWRNSSSSIPESCKDPMESFLRLFLIVSQSKTTITVLMCACVSSDSDSAPNQRHLRTSHLPNPEPCICQTFTFRRFDLKGSPQLKVRGLTSQLKSFFGQCSWFQNNSSRREYQKTKM